MAFLIDASCLFSNNLVYIIFTLLKNIAFLCLHNSSKLRLTLSDINVDKKATGERDPPG